MLKDSLYTIQNITEENNTIEAIIELDEHHAIFQGHFPGQPVLPGVCMLQMTKEILEIFFNYKVQLSKADDIRFLSMIQPSGADPEFFIQYSYKDPLLNIAAKITVNEVVCCKLKASFNIKS